MDKDIFRKGLVFGVIVLFVGVSVIPVNASISKNVSDIEKNNMTQTYIYNHKNWLGDINISFNSMLVEISPQITITSASPTERNYTFPVQNDKATLNFTVNCGAWSDGIFVGPRLAIYFIGIGIEDKSVGSKKSMQLVSSSNFEPLINSVIVESYPIDAQPGIPQNGSVSLAGFAIAPFPKFEYEVFNISVNFTEAP